MTGTCSGAPGDGSGRPPTISHVSGVTRSGSTWPVISSPSTVPGIVDSHRTTGQGLLGQAAAEHQQLTARLPPDVSESIPVDAQGITRAIDHLASAVGFSDS